MNTTPDYILYVGHYLDEKIVDERGLPTRNAAGSNRMQRLADALHSVGERILIISPGISMRVRWRGRVTHPVKLHQAGFVPALFTRALGLPIIGMLTEGLFLIGTIRSISTRRRIKAVIVYNFSPSLLLIAFFVRLGLGITLIHNVEDVSIPHTVDWRYSSEVRPLQQIVYYFCMRMMFWIADGFIIPTARFVPFLPKSRPHVIITGCMPLIHSSTSNVHCKHGSRQIRIIFAGKVEFDHGIRYLIDALRSIAKDALLGQQFHIDICGIGSKLEWTRQQAQGLRGISIKVHGFLCDSDYRNLLEMADVCLALQDPSGRSSMTNTPSKVYEFLAYGKSVITTDVGDLAQLPSNVITICHPITAYNLYQKLIAILEQADYLNDMKRSAAQYAINNYSYPIVGRQLIELIEKAVITRRMFY